MTDGHFFSNNKKSKKKDKPDIIVTNEGYQSYSPRPPREPSAESYQEKSDKAEISHLQTTVTVPRTHAIQMPVGGSQVDFVVTTPAKLAQRNKQPAKKANFGSVGPTGHPYFHKGLA